jgi:Glycosyltransferase family 87
MLSMKIALRRILFILVAIIVLVMCIQMLRKAHRVQGIDFTSYLLSARTLLHGQNPYQTDSIFPYLYPLFLCCLLIPLLSLPFWLSSLIWFFVNLFSLIHATYVLILTARNDLDIEWSPHLIGPLCILFILFLAPIQNNLVNGQVNLLVLMFCVLFLKYFLSNKTIPASIFLSLAIAIKLLPVLLFLYVLFRKGYKVILFSTCLVAIFCLLPAMFAGRRIFEFYEYYFNIFLIRGTAKSLSYGSSQFTLDGLIANIFPATAHALWPRIIAWISVMAPLIGIEIDRLRNGKQNNNVWIFTSYLLAMLLLSPLSETHHLILAFPAICLVSLKLLFRDEPLTKLTIASLGFWVMFFLGNYFKHGPYYYFSLLILFCLTISLPLFLNRGLKPSSRM